jgi:hypothetical protein
VMDLDEVDLTDNPRRLRLNVLRFFQRLFLEPHRIA